VAINQLDIERVSGLAAVRPARRIVVAASFTAEPVQDILEFWMGELNLPATVEFAPYDQVFQQLLDPGSALSQNYQGVNVVLVRLEDWMRLRLGVERHESLEESLARNAADLVSAARGAVARSTAPLIIGICPDSPAARVDRVALALLTRIADWIMGELGSVSGIYLLGPADFDLYPTADYYDLRRDQLGHIPYTPSFFAALGTILSRKVHSLINRPYKVVVLDCDNTLWKGVVGEEGITGITIPPPWMALQQFMLKLASQGFLLCLCSKNDEPDVLDVFDRRPDMVLKREHMVSWRINWQPKSRNIRTLAQELNLGLDSFIFVDDNPVECAEVRAGCPEVLTLRLPIDGDIEGFLRHVWAFDRLRVTSEDQQRTTMYKQEADRARFQRDAPTIDEFLAGLDLRVTISEPVPEQVDRIAQLTQRTNQFNFTTIRRNDGEIRRLVESGLECRAVEVRDRFGDYGLVGVMIFGGRGTALEVDTFLLSCRVLGRGVEHRMLNELSEIARSRQMSLIAATLAPTKKNQPARDFLEGVDASYRRQVEGGWRYEVPVEVAATVAYSQKTSNGVNRMMVEATEAVSMVSDTAAPGGKSQRFERIANELVMPEQIIKAVNALSSRRRARPALSQPLIPPRTEIEAELAEIWVELLRLEKLGIHDNYFDLGGTSLLAVDLFARIEHRFGKKLPLTSLIEASTIEQLARLVVGGADQDSLVLIREGRDRPPLFLVHDGDGETMLYRNLALHLKADRAVYGLQPHSRPDVPMAHVRIAEMAAYHIDKMRSIQPRGPYLVGGMCAGGVIAFEIALQLQSAAEKVVLVALIDAADVTASLKTWRFASQRIRGFTSALHQDRAIPFDHRVLAALTKALGKAKNLSTYLVRHRLKILRDEIRMRLFRFCLDRRWSLPRALQQIPVRTVYLFAEKNYQPKGPFNGDLVLFRATHGEGHDEPYINRYLDPLLGWGQRARGSVRAHDVPGGHSSMLQQPHVQILADQLQSSIDEALLDEPVFPHASALADSSRHASQPVPTIR
jgi:FkbH-like protein